MNRYATASGFSSVPTMPRARRIAAPKTGRWALVGSGPLAEAIAAAWPFRDIKLVQWPTFDRDAPMVDGVLECVGGIAPALDVALTALARGVPVVTANALLLATHGRVLQAAAAGAGLGCEGALLGSVPVGTMLHDARTLQMTFGGGADTLLLRMRYRGESAAQAESALRQMGVAMDDVAGKATMARAMTLFGLWRHQWPLPGQVRRVAAAEVTAMDLSGLTEQGFSLRYGARLEADSLYVGPLVMKDNGSVAGATGGWALDGAVLQMDSRLGSQTLQAQGNPLARMVAGMVYDVQRAMHNLLVTMPALPEDLRAVDQPRHWYVRADYDVKGELVTAATTPEGVLVLPVNGSLPQRDGLRRVA